MHCDTTHSKALFFKLGLFTMSDSISVGWGLDACQNGEEENQQFEETMLKLLGINYGSLAEVTKEVSHEYSFSGASSETSPLLAY